MPSTNLKYVEGSRPPTGAAIAAQNPTLSAESARLTAGTHVDGVHTRQQSPGARSVQTILERRFAPGVEENAVNKSPSATKGLINAVMARRFVKIALGIGLVVAFGWAPLRAMLATTSVEAIVNARIETIRAPIEGIVQAPADKNANWSATEAPPRLTINNPYADRSRLDELRRDLNTLEVATGNAWAAIAIGADRARHGQPPGRKIPRRSPQVD